VKLLTSYIDYRDCCLISILIVLAWLYSAVAPFPDEKENSGSSVPVLRHQSECFLNVPKCAMFN
jgi:hypothetical protein